MVRAHPSLRIPGPDRLPLRLQHLWDDVAERPATGARSVTEARGRLADLRIVGDHSDAPTNDRRRLMTVA